ncbi:MAG TPA: flagellar hook-length control protein FliK, partial [Bordetella sp.]
PTQTNSPATLAPNASWGSAAGLTATQNAPGSLLNTPGGASGNSATSLNLSSALGADNSNPLAGIHPDATTLVRQQLDVLANQALAWQGQAWPGVEMEWEVERDRSQGGEIIDDTHWATRLQLELPRLGLVQARLNLSGNQVILSLVAPSSAGELNQNSEALRHRFAAAGLTLSQLSVDAQPPSPFDLP